MRFILRHERQIAWFLFPALLVAAYMLGNLQQRYVELAVLAREAAPQAETVAAPTPEAPAPIEPQRDEMWWQYSSGVEMQGVSVEDVAPEWREEAFRLDRKPIPLPEPKPPF